jgi:Xaa-Pro aminopeptidase
MAKDSQRRDMILQTLQESRLEAFASFSTTGVLLLTGYWPVMGTSIAFCSRKGELCVIVPEDELEFAKATSDTEFFAYKPATLDRVVPFTGSLVGPIKGLASQLKLKSGEVGIDLGSGAESSSYPSVNHFRASILTLLSESTPELTAVLADKLLERLKAVKTAIEVNILRLVCQRAAVGFREAEVAIAPGRREDEVAADIERAFARTANDGFERSRCYFFCMSGPNSYSACGAYARTRSRVLHDGDLVIIHANTVGDGYWTDITRTWVVGFAMTSSNTCIPNPTTSSKPA